MPVPPAAVQAAPVQQQQQQRQQPQDAAAATAVSTPPAALQAGMLGGMVRSGSLNALGPAAMGGAVAGAQAGAAPGVSCAAAYTVMARQLSTGLTQYFDRIAEGNEEETPEF
jgi:predicted lipid-binding transport protein (Tim44 family)